MARTTSKHVQERVPLVAGRKRRASALNESTRRTSKRLGDSRENRATVKARAKGDQSREPSEDDLSSAHETVLDEPSEDSDSEDGNKKAPKKKGRGYEVNKSQRSAPLDTSTGLGPGRELVRKLPKPRAAGKTPYQDATLHPNTFLFLADLAENNDRDWLKEHDQDFRAAEKDFSSFLEVLSQQIMERDDTIPELPIKDIKFRIYRDIRFSPDPTPYKPYFSAAWSRTGRKSSGYAAYYLQIEGSGAFLGGGLWHPDALPLAALRRNIDQRPHKIKDVLTQPGLRKDFFGGVPDRQELAVKAFIDNNREGMLKTKPKGYPKDHAEIELLRLRNFTVSQRLKKEEVLEESALDRIADMFGSLTPWITYLNSVVMPDDNPSEGDPASGDESAQDTEPE